MTGPVPKLSLVVNTIAEVDRLRLQGIEAKLNVDHVRDYILAEIDQMALYDKRARGALIGSLADAIHLYVGPLIEQAIEALAMLPPDVSWRRTMGIAADVISMARANNVSLHAVHIILVREARDES